MSINLPKNDYLGRAKQLALGTIGMWSEVRLMGLALINIAQSLRHIEAHLCEENKTWIGQKPEGWECTLNKEVR